MTERFQIRFDPWNFENVLEIRQTYGGWLRRPEFIPAQGVSKTGSALLAARGWTRVGGLWHSPTAQRSGSIARAQRHLQRKAS